MAKQIDGWWNMYSCIECDIFFAISQETDQSDMVSCPACDSLGIEEGTDFIER